MCPDRPGWKSNLLFCGRCEDLLNSRKSITRVLNFGGSIGGDKGWIVTTQDKDYGSIVPPFTIVWFGNDTWARERMVD